MSETSTRSRLARNVSVAMVFLAIWIALVLLFAIPLTLTSRVPWREALSFGVSFWGLWMLFLPATVMLAFRFPIERRQFLRNVGFHLLICLIILGTHRASLRVVERTVARAQRSNLFNVFPDSNATQMGPPNAFGAYRSLRTALDVLVYWSVVGMCQAITHFRRSEERGRRAAQLEANLTSAKLQALRMQINPHFLFNTLNSISALVHVDPKAADEMLGDLGELLRCSLHSMEEQEIPLAEELQFISGYLNIEQKRLGDRLRVQQSIPAELMNAMVPALILQPLVENAIRHGIEPQREPGMISIEAKLDHPQLHLTVRDNGGGIVESKAIAQLGFGVGLSNISARLQGLYGKDQHLMISKASPCGCQVDIHIPFHTDRVTFRLGVDEAAS